MAKNLKTYTPDKEIIDITLYGEDNIKSGKNIIFVHGFKGFKDWGFGPYLAEFFSKKGFFVLTFNFSLNGVGSGTAEFNEPDKFAANTISREVEELNGIIAALKNGEFGPVSKDSKTGLLGHSRGGGVSLLCASANENVDAVATWSAVSDFNRYSARQKQQWHEIGYFEVTNARTGQVMRMNESYITDIEKNGESSLNVAKAVKNMNKPLLLAHGEQDLAVPAEEAKFLFDVSDKNLTELFLISAAGHTFDIKHPFEGSNKKFDKLLDKTTKFFEVNLS